MPRPLKSHDVAGQRIVGVFRARLPGDPANYSGEDGDFFRVFIALESGSYLEMFDDLHDGEAVLLFTASEAALLQLKLVQQVMAQDCVGQTVQGVSRSTRNVTTVWLTSGQIITVESDFDTVVCLQEADEYRRDCPWFFEGMKAIGEL
jgi:hypothetical protein